MMRIALLLTYIGLFFQVQAQGDYLTRKVNQAYTILDSFQLKEQYYPFTSLGDAVITLPVSFVVITDSSKNQGLSHSEETRRSLQISIDEMNALYSHNAQPVDEMPGRAYVEDVKVRVALREVYFLDDPELYEFRQLSGLYQKLYERYPEIRNTLVIVCNRFLYTGALGWASSVQPNGEKEPGFIIQTLLVEDQYFYGYENEYAQHWVHEINHLFGLGHIYSGSIGTETCDPRNPDYLSDVFGTAPQEWCEAPRAPCVACYYTKEHSIHTNNIMSGNNVKSPSSAAYFSPMQIARIHRQLMISPLSLIADGYAPNRPFRIERTDTLTRDIRFYQDVYIPKGVTWVVKGNVTMSENCVLYIEPGALLLVDGGSINPASYRTYKNWRGLRMLREGTVRGMVRLINGGQVNTSPPNQESPFLPKN